MRGHIVQPQRRLAESRPAVRTSRAGQRGSAECKMLVGGASKNTTDGDTLQNPSDEEESPEQVCVFSKCTPVLPPPLIRCLQLPPRRHGSRGGPGRAPALNSWLVCTQPPRQPRQPRCWVLRLCSPREHDGTE
ncbi:hypothetical protein HPB50_019203 [Hyalomma asiaticum]|uniref:Uncharacterized protein n=1 Tax=Hyalomma asiaticum TaxID=266040 RepID=A0ACB7TMD0_HYAAI|nr:hypothetical protein HPB50_019203 [Hyalomma asiaticum]